jgi:tRNA dimethylallyltransferase
MQRLRNGMVEEVQGLIAQGVPTETLCYYGLEYKYITEYLMQKLTYEQLIDRLNTAIHQFAKRQMTWFRGMERRGAVIHWIDGNLDLEKKLAAIERVMRDE